MYLDTSIVVRKAANHIAEKFPKLTLSEAEECAEIVMQEEHDEMVRVGIVDDDSPMITPEEMERLGITADQLPDMSKDRKKN